MAQPDTTGGAGRPERTRRPPGPTGWAVFAGVVLLMLGFLNFFWGLGGILEDENLIVGGNGAIIVDLTAWGWATLIVGMLQVLVGLGLLTAQEWARWAGIFIAALAAIGQIGIVTAFPIWSFIVILLAVLVIYNLTVHWEEPAPRRPGGRQP
jgi:hypothetical protein